MLMGRNQPVEVTRKKSLGQAKVTEMSQEEIISVADVQDWTEKRFLFYVAREKEGWIATDPVYRFVAGS